MKSWFRSLAPTVPIAFVVRIVGVRKDGDRAVAFVFTVLVTKNGRF